ncbi:hypothetical protein GTA08_BOTSDO10228 [Neofusicoccum parvum]|nr:hypothetical protein GTA08_BOTSDO10228 [Neofusicoccum parvum]
MAEQQPRETIQLDHFIVLLPHRDILDPPSWITRHFTLSPGGRHADGKTENKLIVFQDGTYIELIAFIDDDPTNKDGHWWGDKRYGFIDWALTSPSVGDASRAAARLDEWAGKQTDQDLAGFAYAQPRQGGRRKPNGEEIAWFVTFPQGAKRGVAPFWCHDVTPRELRVPADPHDLQHPCGAVGIGNLVVSTAASARLAGAYDAILARPGIPTAHGASKGGHEWSVEAPRTLGDPPTPKVTLCPSGGNQQAHDIDAEIRIELVVESGGEAQVPGPISERVGLHGEGRIDISFVKAEGSDP